MLDFFKDIESELSVFRRDLSAFQANLRRGRLESAETFLRTYEGRYDLGADKRLALTHFIEKPEKWAKPAAAIALMTESRFSFDDFFKGRRDRDESEYWQVYARHATPDVARASAIILSEYLRFKLVRDLDYIPVLQISTREAGLTGENDTARRRDSVMATQHALADYVSEMGPKLPVNRGAAFLYHFANEVKPEAARLWTQKIETFAERRFDDIKSGNGIKYVPQFRP